MTPTLVTALTGFFVFSGVGGLSTDIPPKSDPLETAPTYETRTVSMTGYNAVPEQTDGDPFTTASGAFSNPDIIAARSVDLAGDLPFGTVIAISTATSTNNCGLGLVKEQLGLRVIGDSMHPRKRNQIDILFDKDDTVWARGKKMNPALVLGVCKDIEIAIVGHIDIRRIPKTQAALRAALVAQTAAESSSLAINK